MDQRFLNIPVREVVAEDAEWPSGLDALLDGAPGRLWLRGVSLLAMKCPVAIVGARASTPYGDRVATELAVALTEAGCAVLTGGSFGIEGAATRGVLAAGGSPVVALPGGIDQPHPRAHGELFAEVALRGTLLTGFAPGVLPSRQRFIERSRLLAALSVAVVLVEASSRSGALAVVDEAQRSGRLLMAVPGPASSITSQLPHLLIRQGSASLVTDANDVLEFLAP